MFVFNMSIFFCYRYIELNYDYKVYSQLSFWFVSHSLIFNVADILQKLNFLLEIYENNENNKQRWILGSSGTHDTYSEYIQTNSQCKSLRYF